MKRVYLKIYWLTALLILFLFTSYGQNYQVSGYIFDSLTGNSLAFVNIRIDDTHRGGMTDIDGHFTLQSDKPIQTLKISYIGYKNVEYSVQGKQKHTILLTPEVINLPEAVIAPSMNPALRIIANAVKNRSKNNPKYYKAFTYDSYDKVVFTLMKDSLSQISINDTNDAKIEKLLKRQHLFMMESVIEHKHLFPSLSHSKIVASKVSGLNDPLMALFISQSQPESFYESTIDLAGKKYLNPLNEGFERNYYFELKDKYYSSKGQDSLFIISFNPLKGKNFDGLKGLLYISNNGWAISNVIAEPARSDDPFSLRIQQMYEFIDSSYWFPVQLNTDINFKNLKFSSTNVYAIGKSYRRNISFNAELVRKHFNEIAVEVDEYANKRTNDFWDQQRKDSLTMIEENTYRIIDSLSKAHRINEKITALNSLARGFIPIGPVNLDINRLLRINKYEQINLGLGLYTNEKVSDYFSVGGFYSYGFKDKEPKFGGSLALYPKSFNAFSLLLKHYKDITESAGVKFFDEESTALSADKYREFYISQFDLSTSYEVSALFKPVRYVAANVGFAKAEKSPLYEYQWTRSQTNDVVNTGTLNFTTLTLGLRYAHKEKFIRGLKDQYSLGTNYPVIRLKYTGSIAGVFSNDISYNKFDIKVTWQVYNKLCGTTSLYLLAGYIDRDAPYSELYNGRGSAGEVLSLYSPGSFNTMESNEFLSDRYAALFLIHDFGKLLLRSKYFQPDIALNVNMGIGSLQHPENHKMVNFKTLEKGFIESGILLNNILRSSYSGIGIGLFYRGDRYRSYNELENLFVRLTIRYSM